MDSPGSEMSSETTDSSSAETTSHAASPAQTVPVLPHNPVGTTNATSILDDDSASDVSMSADSDEDEDNSSIQVNPGVQTLDVSIQEPAPDISKKQKFPGSGDPHESQRRLKEAEGPQTRWTSKDPLPRDRSLLPAEVWHQIFTFCPPRVLGLLLQVNKAFNTYLDPSLPDLPITTLLKPNAIWQASRRLFRPSMPAPLRGRSELDMWKLACCSSCQFCGKKRPRQNPTAWDQWHPGPGENGVVPIWSFDIRTCGSCLQRRSSKVGNCVAFFALYCANSLTGNRLTVILFHSIYSKGCAAICVYHQ